MSVQLSSETSTHDLFLKEKKKERKESLIWGNKVSPYSWPGIPQNMILFNSTFPPVKYQGKPYGSRRDVPLGIEDLCIPGTVLGCSGIK